MQPSKSDLLHSLALFLRDYPDGIPASAVSASIAQEDIQSARKVIFYSPKDCSKEGIQLLEGALTKGLQLQTKQYQIIVGKEEFEKIFSSVNSPDKLFIVRFGDDEADYPVQLQTDAPDELAQNRDKKKRFWEELQSAWNGSNYLS